MSKRKKKKRNAKDMTLGMIDLLLNSSGKLGRHDAVVRAGCGVQPSKKDYNRKSKHKKKIEIEN